MSVYSIFKQVAEVSLEIAFRAKKMRKTLKYTQSQMAKKSGISLGSLQRFEQTGEISLNSLLKISQIIDCLADFDELFKEKVKINKNIEKLFE